jgi:hypothetical protein
MTYQLDIAWLVLCDSQEFGVPSLSRKALVPQTVISIPLAMILAQFTSPKSSPFYLS